MSNPYNARYPFNRVNQTESGHVIEIDDTPNGERINIEHMSGSFIEMHPDGSIRILNEGTHELLIEKAHNQHTKGNFNSYVSGTATGISKTMVGLGNVDNTSDTNKPVSTATQTALDLKANLASPTLTGTPVAPTATAGTITTQIATTEFVKTALDDNSPLLKEKIQRIIDENSPGLESDVVFTNLEIFSPLSKKKIHSVILIPIK